MIIKSFTTVPTRKSLEYRKQLVSVADHPSMTYYRHMLRFTHLEASAIGLMTSHWYYIVDGDILIGEIYLYDYFESDLGNIGELNYVILPEHQHKGYATEALRLFLHILSRNKRYGGVSAAVNVDNHFSELVLIKNQFVLKETISDYYSGFPCNDGKIYIQYFKEDL